jgi:AcrR family transcriptional regulator
MASIKVKPTKKSVTDTTARGDRTRQQIKKVIAELANKKELSEITLADICKATKLTTGAVYFHFSGRDEAIEEMVIDEVKALYAEQLAGSSVSFESFVAAIIDANTRYNLKNKQMPRAIATAIFSKPRVYQAWLEARRPVVEQLQSLIAQKREERSLPLATRPILAHFHPQLHRRSRNRRFQWRIRLVSTSRLILTRGEDRQNQDVGMDYPRPVRKHDATA